ncbi:MAG TPA: peptide ABC transporter substrate-binding protein [Ktedonobacterales bacterium]|nr:peptide ABC transporter substrate-binding protein [Ktedonobacterales bacterium]
MRGIEALFRGNRGPTTRTRRHGSSAARTLTLLVGALSLMLSACSGGLGGQGSAATLAANQTFTWPYVTSAGVFGHNEVLDPAEISTLNDAGTISMLFTGLVTFSPTYQVQGDAAQTWDPDPTGTIYTFHLRSNLFFSDGKPITASDFAYSIDRALSPTLCSAASAYNANGLCYQAGQTYLSHILGAQDRLSGAISTMIGNGDDPKKGLDVLDARTLRIRLDAPISFFLQALTYSTADAVEKSMVDNPQYAGGTWVDHLDQGGASGPFKLKSYGDGTKMTFVPNPYWEKAFGQQLTLTQVIRPAIAKTDAEYANYQAGAFDYTDVPAIQYSFARGQSDFHSVPALETDYFGMNTKVAPFDKLQVRQAFDLALNKQLLVDRVENGGAIPTNHIVPQGMPGFDVGLKNPAPDSTQSLTGNQPAAASLLKQAAASCPAAGTFGAPDYCAYITGSSPQEIDVYAPEEDPTRMRIAELAAQEWSATLGLNIKAKPISFGALVGDIIKPATADPLAIWEIAWIADYPDPQDWLTLQFATGAPNNSEGYSDPTLDGILKKADAEQNVTTRMQLYNQAEQLVVNQSLWIPYQQAKIYWRQRDWVRGFGFNPGGLMVDINWPKVYIAKH